ncbi:MAG: hypothetical protein RQ875_08250 [Vicingaceae bacterium]|nr:hypothetical protein [Vicingaceae bacterium]
MFNIIDSFKTITDYDVMKKLKITSKSNLSVMESRLQTLILKHLRAFHANSSQEIELHHLLVEIEILYTKRLYKNCAKHILKAKKIAGNCDNHIALLGLLRWESLIEKEQGKYLIQSQNNLKEILQKENQLLKKYEQLIEYKYHTFNLLLLSKNKIVAQLHEEMKYYSKLFKKGFFNITTEHTFEDKLYLLNFKGMYYMSKGKIDKCLLVYIQLVNEIESSKRKNILKSNEYFLALNNLLLLEVLNKNYDRYRTTLKKIHTHFDDLIGYKPLLFNITTCYELGIYCEIGEEKKALALVPEIEKNLILFDEETNEINKLLFYLNIAITYLFNENYSKSIYWLNIFLNNYSIKRNDVSSNIYYYGHIINIIAHFEAKNYESINYLYNQSVNNLKKIRPLNQFDDAVLKFIKKNASIKSIDYKEQPASFKALKEKLELLIKDPKETISLHFFDFFAWIDSHLKKEKIATLIKKKKLG